MEEKIKVKIDVTKLDKDRFFRGKKGTYCDLVLIPTPSSNYGKWGAVQQSTKEERDNGVKLPFVGNADYAFENKGQTATVDGGDSRQGFEGSQASQSERPMAQNITHSNTMVEDGDEIPF